ncbi:MAG: TRAP transporter small permease [Desulfatiglandaceae bacterium]|jgi:TRAP-type mannitol/chloroaromatic compound transport system permease small subunit
MPDNPGNQKNPNKPRSRRFRYSDITSVMNSIGTAWVFVLLVIINMDIGGRALFNHPIRGVPEIVALSITACVFLQLAHTLKVGRLTRSDLLLNWLHKKHPGIGALLQGLHHLIGAVVMMIMFKASLPLFAKAWRLDVYVGAEGDFMAPVWPVKLIIIVGCVAATIQFILLAWNDFKSLGGRELLQPGSGSDSE